MKKSLHKGVIEEKISSKINAIIDELKIKKGNAITKSIADASKKIAKMVAKKLKALENETGEIKDKILRKEPVSKPSVKLSKKTAEKKVKSPKAKVPSIRAGIKKVVKTTAPKVALVAKTPRKVTAVPKVKPTAKKPEPPVSTAPDSKVVQKPTRTVRPKPTIKKAIPPVVVKVSESPSESVVSDQKPSEA